MAKLANAKGEMVYFNLVQKSGAGQGSPEEEVPHLHPGSPGGCLSEAQRVHDQPLLKGRSR